MCILWFPKFSNILTFCICIQGPQKVKYGKVGFPDNIVTAKDIIIATGSVPFVPKGIEVDGINYFHFLFL